MSRFDANGVAVLSTGDVDKPVTHEQLHRVTVTLLDNDERLSENHKRLLAALEQVTERLGILEAKLGAPE